MKINKTLSTIALAIGVFPIMALANVTCYQGSGALCSAQAGQSITAGNPPASAGMGPATDANLVWTFYNTSTTIVSGKTYNCTVSNYNGNSTGTGNYGFYVFTGTFGTIQTPDIQVTQAGVTIPVVATDAGAKINALGFMVDAQYATGPSWLNQGPQADFVCKAQ